jgi:hypothetical protein
VVPAPEIKTETKSATPKKLAAKPATPYGATPTHATANPKPPTPRPTPPEPAASKSTAQKPVAPNPAPRKVGRKLAVRIPPLLLEGDQPTAKSPGGPGRRYALGPATTVEQFGQEQELPEAYGTQRLLLTARDPHWLYAHWDLTPDQQRNYNALSADGHLVLRIYVNEIAGKHVSEVHVHPESRHWFVHVERAGTKYAAELGYHRRGRHWQRISTSRPTLTPPEAMSSDMTAQFLTLPVEVPFAKLLSVVKEAVKENLPLAAALEALRAAGHRDLPPQIAEWQAEISPPTRWTPAQERALAEVITMDRTQRVWIGSLEITELIRRQLEREISSSAAAQLGLAAAVPGELGSVSSPFGAAGRRPKGFWFNVNAELIIYGATEPNARVIIGDRAIKLRPDGSFSYRFTLPDGKYEIPAAATSADGEDTRRANLKFSRRTEYRGDVGAHRQDEKLKAPTLDNVG